MGFTEEEKRKAPKIPKAELRKAERQANKAFQGFFVKKKKRK